MEKIRKPYIGITGFMSAAEVASVLAGVDLQTAQRVLMVGVLASLKTVKGEPSKWPNRYPQLNEIAGIFPDNPNCLNLIHYATSEPETLAEQLSKMVEVGGPHLNGFQLNINLPDPEQLKIFKQQYPDKVIVFAATKKVLDLTANSPLVLGVKLKDLYENLIDYVLFDPSGGAGKAFDPDVARNYSSELSNYRNLFTVGVAGGLGPDTLDLLKPLATWDWFADLCIDAEGKLRTSLPEDKLDVQAAKTYLQKALMLFSGRRLV